MPEHEPGSSEQDPHLGENPVSFPLSCPDVLLQGEALLALLVSSWGFHHLFPHNWIKFALLFFVPDLALRGYGIKQWKHAHTLYNLVHSYSLPLYLGLVACVTLCHEAGFLSLIWLSHISFDRLPGYGLKYPDLFKYTHIESLRSATGEPANAA